MPSSYTAFLKLWKRSITKRRIPKSAFRSKPKMAASKVSLKLLVDKSGKKVLFAEAGKDFIDFLFNLMSMPLGTVTRLLHKKSMVGSVGNLYNSIETLSETYLQTNQIKESLLKPKMPSSALDVPALLPNYRGNNTSGNGTEVAKKMYECISANAGSQKNKFTGSKKKKKSISANQLSRDSGCRPYVSDDPHAVCPHCKNEMTRELTYVVPPPDAVPTYAATAAGGFVKGVVTYMVTDNLVVSPMSTISSITLLNKFGIKGIDSLEERVVELGMDEGLKLLKESLQSKAVLTSVFLKN